MARKVDNICFAELLSTRSLQESRGLVCGMTILFRSQSCWRKARTKALGELMVKARMVNLRSRIFWFLKRFGHFTGLVDQNRRVDSGQRKKA
jgi:hypothetical protein